MKFSLQSIFAAIFVASVFCCVCFALPSVIAVCILALGILLMPAALVSGIVYTTGYRRAFCIGAVSTGGLIPFVYVFTSSMMMFASFRDLSTDEETMMQSKVLLCIFIMLICLSGLTAVFIRWIAVDSVAAGATPSPSNDPNEVIDQRVATSSPSQLEVADQNAAS